MGFGYQKLQGGILHPHIHDLGRYWLETCAMSERSSHEVASCWPMVLLLLLFDFNSVFCYSGGASIIQCHILNDKRHILTKDTNSNLAYWDVLKVCLLSVCYPYVCFGYVFLFDHEMNDILDCLAFGLIRHVRLKTWGRWNLKRRSRNDSKWSMCQTGSLWI